MNPHFCREVDGMQCYWAYKPERLSFACWWRYWRRAFGVRRAPNFSVLKEVSSNPLWIIYFMYSPAGRLEPHQAFALRRLKEHGIPLLVVVASPAPFDVPQTVLDHADAVYWKALSGYDFSAYAIALRAIARRSSGARVLVMNDSVFGPYGDLTSYIEAAPWDLTGFTATDGGSQRHIQTYAFIMKDVTVARLNALRWIFPTKLAWNTAYGAISCQELWFAREAARSMSVGSFWWGATSAAVHDPSLTNAIELIDAGFPFLKRSLLARQSRFHPPGDIELLRRKLDTQWSEPAEASRRCPRGRGQPCYSSS